MSSSQKVITDDDKSALIQVLALFLLSLNILACFVRSGAKLYITKALKADDLLTIVGTLFSVGQTVATYAACEYGLGKHFDLLSPRNGELFLKSQYTADVLFVLTVGCCKLAFANGLRMLAKKDLLPLVLGCEVVAGVWAVSALVVVLFQCRLPTPWATVPGGSQCISQIGFYTYFSVVNLATDLAMVALMCWSVSKLHTSWPNKVLVISVYGSRVLMVPAIILQIIFSNRAFHSKNDFTFASWEASIAVLVVQCLAVFSVCLPNFKFLLDTLESGQVRIDDMRRQGRTNVDSSGHHRYGYGHSSGHSAGTAAKASAPGSAVRSLGSRSDPLDVLQSSRPMPVSQTAGEVHEMATFSTVTAGKTRDQDDPSNSASAWDRKSQESQESQTILIHQTWQVDSQSVRGRGAALQAEMS